jgi:4-amino-4-deoxy-L-arabinose transferase-like glycosyltransferase
VLLVIVVVALGIRIGYIAGAKSGPCPIALPDGTVLGSSPSKCTGSNDQVYYNGQANAVAKGDGFNEPFWVVTHPGEKAPPAADHPPLTVFVLAPVSWLVEHPPLSWVIDEPLHDHVREHRYTMAVLGTLLVLLVGLLGRRIGGDAVGLVAAGIAAINPNIWINDGLVMSETVTALTVVGAMWAAFALWERPTLLRAAGLGILCGLAALARAELILFVALFAIVIVCTVAKPWSDRAALAVAAVAMSVLVVAPWVGFNLARFHDRTFISTNDGIALLGSNCDPVYHGNAIGLTSLGECLENPPPPGDQSQVASHYRRKAFDYIKDHKGRVPLVMLARVGRTWSLFRPGDMIDFNVGEDRDRWVTRLGLVFYFPELVAAIGGGIVLWRRRRRRVLWVLAVPAIAVTIGVALTYGQTRFRAAAEPSIALFAAVGVVAAVRAVTGRREPEPVPAPTAAPAASVTP